MLFKVNFWIDNIHDTKFKVYKKLGQEEYPPSLLSPCHLGSSPHRQPASSVSFQRQVLFKFSAHARVCVCMRMCTFICRYIFLFTQMIISLTPCSAPCFSHYPHIHTTSVPMKLSRSIWRIWRYRDLFFNQSLFKEYLGCIQSFVDTNNTAKNITYLPFCTYVSTGYS